MILVIIYKLSDCDQPLLKDLYEHVVPSVADKWRDIGVYLLHPTLIDNRALEVIAANHPQSVEGCCKSMFKKWLENQKDASWNQLIEVIKSIGLPFLAIKLEKDVIGKVYSLSSCIAISIKKYKLIPIIKSLLFCLILTSFAIPL